MQFHSIRGRASSCTAFIASPAIRCMSVSLCARLESRCWSIPRGCCSPSRSASFLSIASSSRAKNDISSASSERNISTTNAVSGVGSSVHWADRNSAYPDPIQKVLSKTKAPFAFLANSSVSSPMSERGKALTSDFALAARLHHLSAAACPRGDLLRFAPDDVFVVSAIDERIDLSVIGVAKQNAALYALTEKDIGSLWKELLAFAFSLNV